MASFLMRKEYQVTATEQQARDHLVEYCTGLGFKLASSEFPLRFTRGSALGTLASSSPKKWDANLVATIHPGQGGGAVVVLEEQVNTSGQLFIKKQKEQLAKELDGLFASPSFERAEPDRLHRGMGFAEETYKMERQFKGGANWFFWIAGLSIVNSLIFRFGGSASFLAGLGATQLIDGIASGIEELITPSLRPLVVIGAIAANLLVAGYYAALGVFVRRRSKFAFTLGLASYIVDAVIFLAVRDFWGFGFHIFVCLFLLAGMNALYKLGELETAKPVAG